MARRRPGHILPFRIPFFRIFYSTTYTTIYIVCLAMLAITPVSMGWQAIQADALQYIVMIGGAYLLTAIIAIFIYASRLYTNRTMIAGVGKAYVPIEDGEIGKSVRKMIVGQLERSAIVAWEGRPRDLLRGRSYDEQQGILPADTMSLEGKVNTVGQEIPLDPAYPPWGDVQHAGWTSPAQRHDHEPPSIQFAPVVKELPSLIEARAVSLAPADPLSTPHEGLAPADPVVVDVLQRPKTMGLRDYLTQLSYLGLIHPVEVGQRFLHQYDYARFAGEPIFEHEFRNLMDTFSELLAGMTELDAEIVRQIRLQAADRADANDAIGMLEPQNSPPDTPNSSIISPVTARTAPSRTVTPYLQHDVPSTESFDSVVHNAPIGGTADNRPRRRRSYSPDSVSLASTASDTGSVVRHSASHDDG